MKSSNNWQFANQLAAKTFLRFSLFNLCVSIICTEMFNINIINIIIGVILLEFIFLVYIVEKKLNQKEITH